METVSRPHERAAPPRQGNNQPETRLEEAQLSLSDEGRLTLRANAARDFASLQVRALVSGPLNQWVSLAQEPSSNPDACEFIASFGAPNSQLVIDCANQSLACVVSLLTGEGVGRVYFNEVSVGKVMLKGTFASACPVALRGSLDRAQIAPGAVLGPCPFVSRLADGATLSLSNVQEMGLFAPRSSDISQDAYVHWVGSYLNFMALVEKNLGIVPDVGSEGEAILRQMRLERP